MFIIVPLLFVCFIQKNWSQIQTIDIKIDIAIVALLECAIHIQISKQHKIVEIQTDRISIGLYIQMYGISLSRSNTNRLKCMTSKANFHLYTVQKSCQKIGRATKYNCNHIYIVYGISYDWNQAKLPIQQCFMLFLKIATVFFIVLRFTICSN